MTLKVGDTIGLYTVTRDFGTTNAGQGEWGFASKGGKEYFVKKFFAPVKPGPKAPGSAAGKERRNKQCDAFTAKQQRLITALNACGRGGLVVNTLEIFADGDEYGLHYYKVSEKVDTSSLFDQIHTLEKSKRLLVMLTAAGGVKMLHQNGIIHLDLKPDNVLIQNFNERLVAKIIDFETSILVDEIVDDYQTLIGDTAYYAPEFYQYVQTQGESPQPGKPSDIFSLGLIFSEYWWGKKPQFSDKHKYPAEAVLNGEALVLPNGGDEKPPRPTSKLRLSTSLQKLVPKAGDTGDPMEEGIKSLVERMLQKDPSARPTIQEVHKDTMTLRDKGQL